MNILVIEDDLCLSDLLTSKLSNIGYHYFKYDSVEDVLKEQNLNEIDVIISDQNLPGTTGISFLKYIRELQVNLPFILVSGNTFDSNEFSGDLFKDNFKFIPKPYNINHIIETLSTYRKTSGL